MHDVICLNVVIQIRNFNICKVIVVAGSDVRDLVLSFATTETKELNAASVCSYRQCVSMSDSFMLSGCSPEMIFPKNRFWLMVLLEWVEWVHVPVLCL